MPSDFLSDIPIRPCMRSGLCCQKAACAFGTWDTARNQCAHLQIDEQTPLYTRYTCGIKAAIEALPASAGAAFNPAFGGGCCMPLFNDNRAAILRHRPQTSSRGPAS